MLEVELISHHSRSFKVENAERIVDSRDSACEASVGNQKVCQKQAACDILAKNLTTFCLYMIMCMGLNLKVMNQFH